MEVIQWPQAERSGSQSEQAAKDSVLIEGQGRHMQAEMKAATGYTTRVSQPMSLLFGPSCAGKLRPTRCTFSLLPLAFACVLLLCVCVAALAPPSAAAVSDVQIELSFDSTLNGTSWATMSMDRR